MLQKYEGVEGRRRLRSHALLSPDGGQCNNQLHKLTKYFKGKADDEHSRDIQ